MSFVLTENLRKRVDRLPRSALTFDPRQNNLERGVALLRLLDISLTGVDPLTGDPAWDGQTNAFVVLKDHLRVTEQSDKGRLFLHRWFDPQWYWLSKLRDALRRYRTSDADMDTRLANLRRSVELFDRHIKGA